MADWPKRYRAPQDILGGELDDGVPVIPADLGRELYEALNLIRHPAQLTSVTDRERGRESDIKTLERRDQILRALARYEREVG